MALSALGGRHDGMPEEDAVNECLKAHKGSNLGPVPQATGALDPDVHALVSLELAGALTRATKKHIRKIRMGMSHIDASKMKPLNPKPIDPLIMKPNK